MNIEEYSKAIYKIIGAAMEVHKNLKGGLLEPIYNEALVMELEDNNIHAEAELALPCYYKNRLMKKTYRMDIVVGDIIIEIKSVQNITPAHRAQLFNYLRLTHKKVGLLINFGGTSLEGERYVYDAQSNSCYIVDRNMKRMVKVETDNDEIWYEEP
jgi:GxxExxY protein